MNSRIDKLLEENRLAHDNAVSAAHDGSVEELEEASMLFERLEAALRSAIARFYEAEPNDQARNAFDTELENELQSIARPMCPPHPRTRDGERCERCGDKDWMNG